MCSWAMEVKARIDEALLGFGMLVWIGRAELVEGSVDGVRMVWRVQAGGVSLQQRVHQISRARRVNEGRVRTACTVYRYTPDLTPKRRSEDMHREGMAVGLMQSSCSCTGSHRFSPARITPRQLVYVAARQASFSDGACSLSTVLCSMVWIGSGGNIVTVPIELWNWDILGDILRNDSLCAIAGRSGLWASSIQRWYGLVRQSKRDRYGGFHSR
jgi:hypothetical protein